MHATLTHTHMEYHTRAHAHRCTLTQLVPVVRSCDSEEGKNAVAQSGKVCMDCFSQSCARTHTHTHKSTHRTHTHSAVSAFPSRTEEGKQLTRNLTVDEVRIAHHDAAIKFVPYSRLERFDTQACVCAFRAYVRKRACK